MYGQNLIDRARKMCESDAELARKLEVSPVTVHKLRHGLMKLSPETASLLAEIVHDDPTYAATQVMIENADPNLASRLTRAFHRAAMASVAAMLLGGVSEDSRAVTSHDSPTVNTLYIVAHIWRWLRMRNVQAARSLMPLLRGLLRTMTGQQTVQNRHSAFEKAPDAERYVAASELVQQISADCHDDLAGDKMNRQFHAAIMAGASLRDRALCLRHRAPRVPAHSGKRSLARRTSTVEASHALHETRASRCACRPVGPLSRLSRAARSGGAESSHVRPGLPLLTPRFALR